MLNISSFIANNSSILLLVSLCKCLSSHTWQFFVLNVTGGSSQMNDTDVQEQLLWIYEQTQNSEQKQPAVGLLTSDGRTEWSKAREKLLKGDIITQWTRASDQ